MEIESTGIEEALRELNNNIARLVVVQTAIADELNMIRHAVEDDGISGGDIVASTFESLGILDDGIPTFI